VDGFKQSGAGGPQRSRGQHAQRAGNDRGFVRKDVAEDVAGEDDVELGGITHQLHGGVIHVHVAQLHVGVVAVHFHDHFPPQAGGFQHVAFFHGADLVAALAGRFKAHPGNAADFFLSIDHGVEARAQAVARFYAARFAEVDVAGKLAHHHQVQAFGGDVGAEQAGPGQLGQQQGRAQVGEQAQGLADAQQAFFRPFFRRKSVPLGAAHGGQEHGVSLFAGADCGFGQGLACGVNGAPPIWLTQSGTGVLFRWVTHPHPDALARISGPIRRPATGRWTVQLFPRTVLGYLTRLPLRSHRPPWPGCWPRIWQRRRHLRSLVRSRMRPVRRRVPGCRRR
jgi:hypothetical protein